jgi:hypothetical protein
MQVLIHLALYVTSDSNDPQGLGSGQDRPQDVWFTLLSAVSRKRWDFNVWVAFEEPQLFIELGYCPTLVSFKRHERRKTRNNRKSGARRVA